jgi:FAD/FMN-containing dehydrogenase
MDAAQGLVTDLRRAGVEHAVAVEEGPTDSLGAFDTSISYAPEVIVDAERPDDVAAAVAAASRAGLPVVAVSTGHGVLADVSGGLLISTRAMAGVAVDIDRQTARVEAGAVWADVIDAAAQHGLAPLCGSSPTVGVVGYLLGGGIGPIARTYGFSADHVRSVELVTPADGALTATADDQAELFWALRGGKGGFGVITAVTIDLVPLTHVYGGAVFFPADAARDVLSTMVDWAPELPESVTASVAAIRVPDIEQAPPPLRGRFVVHLRFASTGEPAEAEDLLRPIRRLAVPLVDTIAALPYAQIGSVHGDPTAPMPVMSGGAALTTAGQTVVEALLDVAGPERDLPVAVVELRALGGALARSPATPNAVGGRDAAWNLFASAAPVPGIDSATRRDAVRAVLESVRAWRAPTNLANFVGRANDAADLRHSWTDDQNERLDAVRTASDPDRLVSFDAPDHD